MNWILAHFIGDFLLQSDWMAQNKKRSSLVCSIHVFFYMIPFLLADLNYVQLMLIASQHWIQDRSTFIQWYCRVTKIFQPELKANSYWGHCIVDQIFHFIWMYFVVTYI